MKSHALRAVSHRHLEPNPEQGSDLSMEVISRYLSRAAESVAIGFVALAPHFTFQSLRPSEELFLLMILT